MTSLSIKAIGVLAALTMPMTACLAEKANRSVESVHQPVVSYSAYTFDVQAADGLSPSEARRLDDWFGSIGLGYGDQVAIASDDAYVAPAVRDAISDVAARRGMLVGDDSSATAGQPPAGSIRLIVRRATAAVPGCPDWRKKAETDLNLGTSSNYGCATNGNFAAMVANPEDLVRGQNYDSDLRTAQSNRAISTYREKQPTGAGDLKQLSAGGK